MSKVYPRMFDVSEIKDTRFKCIKGCGSCCFTGFVSISTTEIKNILDFLLEIPKKNLKHFLSNWLDALGKSNSLSKKRFSKYRNLLKSFYVSGSFQTINELKFVKTYFLYSFKLTGRCIFLDPIDLTCLIFSVRPIACRLCPITAVVQPGKTRLTIGYSRCPGLNKGDYIDLDEKKNIVLKGYSWLERDFDIFKKYISNKVQTLNEKSLQFDDRNGRIVTKRLVDPFVKKGILPPSLHPHQKLLHKQT